MLSFLALPLLINAQQNPGLSDAEVASVAVAANQIDISYADIAETKSKNSEVLQFARTMKRDHHSVIDQASALVKKLGVTPKNNTISQKRGMIHELGQPSLCLRVERLTTRSPKALQRYSLLLCY